MPVRCINLPGPSWWLCILLVAPSVAWAGSLDDGMALYESGDMAGARSAFNAALKEDPKNARAAFMLGRSHYAEGAAKQAVKWFEKAIKLDPEQSQYHQYFGEALGESLGDANMLTRMRKAGRVRKSFERAIELDPGNLQARRGLIIYYLRAPGIAGGGRDKAEAGARELTRLDAQMGRRAWVDIYVQYQEFASALREIDVILQDNPDDARAMLTRGVLLTEQAEYGAAADHFQAWLERDPEQMSAAYQLGRVSSISGQNLESGEAAMLTYLQHQPGSDEPSLAWANYRLGQIYEHMGRSDAARRAYRVAVELDPKHKEARKALKAID